MQGQVSTRDSDPLLLPYLRAKDKPEADRLLARLLAEQAEPILASIVRRKMQVSLYRQASGPQSRDEQDAEDIHGEAVAQLLTRLETLKAGADGDAIRDFRGYAAVTAYRACDLYLRRKYPQRWSLKNRLRYLLDNRTNQKGFALWTGESGEWLCGFAAWQGQKPFLRSGKYQRLLGAPQAFAQAALPQEDVRRMNPAALLAALFRWVDHPIELDDLVTVVAELREIHDAVPQEEVNPRDGEPDHPLERVASPEPDLSEELALRHYLGQLWQEIRELPPGQSAALLLNLRDGQGRGIIALLPLAGVATLGQIAETLQIPLPEFAALWNDLPLEDAAIAARLGLTRQQVINLRKVARERLGRRMRSF